jgi:hypothetical protein
VLRVLSVTVTHVSPAPVAEAVRRVDFDYATWFWQLGAEAVIVRPDFRVFAALRAATGSGAALDDLADQLRPEHRNPF